MVGLHALQVESKPRIQVNASFSPPAHRAAAESRTPMPDRRGGRAGGHFSRLSVDAIPTAWCRSPLGREEFGCGDWACDSRAPMRPALMMWDGKSGVQDGPRGGKKNAVGVVQTFGERRIGTVA
jgi:hypothetical protein